MFFGKFFSKKDHRHYLTQAGKHLAAERYADARVDLLEALNRCPSDATQDEREIREGLGRAGNLLGELNLREGDHSMNAGEFAKAHDHFTLAGELAVDETIKTMAGEGLKKLQQNVLAAAVARPAKEKAHGGSSCASCKDTGSHAASSEEIPAPDFSEEERFYLMIQPLPGDLSTRYAALGDKFAKAYLLIHDGKDPEAFPILEEMLVSDENDIVIYELALIMFRNGQVHECEVLLNRSLQANPANSMSYLALVHLTAGAGRVPEAISIVKHMLEIGVLADQAQLMLGELHEAAGDHTAARDPDADCEPYLDGRGLIHSDEG